MASTANVKAVITAEDRASGVISGVGGSFTKLSGAMAVGQLAAQAITRAFDMMVGAAKQGIIVAANLETARVGFITLLGSAEKADATMARIKKEAARTPFEIPGLTEATQMLAGVTKDGDRALNFILDIGEGLSAMGRGQAELDRISVNLQQIAATGRAFGIDIRQFAFAGIPIYEMLQDEIGLTGEALQSFIEDGGVTFDLLEKMFKKATDAGGRFHGAFTNQAGTFNQLVSNMKDNFNIFLSDFIKQTGIFDAVKRAFGSLTTFMSANSSSIIAAFNRTFSAIKKVADFLLIPYRVAFDVIKQSWDSIKPALDQLWSKITIELVPALQKLWKQVGPVLGPALKDLGKIIGVTIVIAIVALAKALTYATNALSAFINLQRKLYNAIGIAIRWFNSLSDTIRSRFGAIGDYIVNPVASAFRAIVQIWNNTVGRISFKIPDWIPKIGGKGWSMPKFASGTDFFNGGNALVGERGPEMVTLPRGSKIHRADETRRMVSNSANINITVQAGAFMGSQQDARRYAQVIADALKDIASMKGTTVGSMLA